MGLLGLCDEPVGAVAALCRCLLDDDQDGVIGGVVLAAGYAPEGAAVGAAWWGVEGVVDVPLADVVLVHFGAVVDAVEVPL